MMKVGLGLYRHMLEPANYRFARQAGATHVVAHYLDYIHDEDLPTVSQTDHGFGLTPNEGEPWTYEELRDLRNEIRDHGLQLEAIENLDPAHWYDVLLDGPRKEEQLEYVKDLVRYMGDLDIPVLGYYFSLAGVWGRIEGPFARGGADSVAFDRDRQPEETPIPEGHVWNMTYRPEATDSSIGSVSREEMWKRVGDFLEEVVPVAEDEGVRLAAHPDDPPVPRLRDTGRLIYRPEHYERLLDLVPSTSNVLEFCVGTTAEMEKEEMNLYDAVERYSAMDRIGYVHLRNVVGAVPRYHEAFVDEGDYDMMRVLRLLDENGFEGVVIPDHTPQLECGASWHAGMAYALGWMRAALEAIGRSEQLATRPVEEFSV